jgi:protein-tyrosine phosphatase
MIHTIVFLGLGLYLVALGVGLGGVALILLWPGVSFGVLGTAYAGLGACVLGKQLDGRMAWWAVVLMLPYLLLTWAVWHLQRRMSKEACCNEVVPGLWVGRRPYAKEVPPDVGLVVDLTAEFPEPRGVRAGKSYVCLPILDASIPGEEALRGLIETVAAWRGRTYLHCALGHGRSAMVAAGVLVKRGIAENVRQAVKIVRQARPGARLKRPQWQLLEKIMATDPREASPR